METEKRRVVEGEGRGDAVLDRVLAQRERHRGRPILVRAGVVVAGGAVSIFAAPLSVVVPELGLPLLLFGLRLLALEFDRAARLYARVEKLARGGAWGLLRRLLKSMFRSKRSIAVTVVLWLAVTAAGTALVL